MRVAGLAFDEIVIALDQPDTASRIGEYSPAGRDYLVRVPGVAFVPLPDDEVADLLNWLVVECDPEQVPSDFRAYSAEEVAKLRRATLISEAPRVRSEILQSLNSDESAGH